MVQPSSSYFQASTKAAAAMYADENKRAEAKVVPKATRAGNNVQANRRALADVGNLAGAMSKGCNVKTENQERSFGTNLSNGNENKAKAQGTAGEKWGNKGHRTAGTRSRDSTTSTNGLVAPPQAAPPPLQPAAAHSGLGSTASNGAPGRAKSVVTRAARAAAAAAKAAAAVKEKEQQSLTATLTARAEEAIGGFDAEMTDAEDPLPDIDSEDKDNILAVAEYVTDIYSFYKKAESQSIVSPDYMSAQNDINDKMRGILLDWLVEVHLKFKLMPETLYLTTNLIDRFLAVYSVTRKNLQLVGVTAMLLASKYEEIWAPEVKDFVYISDNAYTKDQILAMEKLMLNTLKFNLTVPTPYVFTARYLKAAQADKEVEVVTWFLVELCLPDYTMLRFSPSHLAAAAVYTAMRTLNRTPSWSTCLQRHSGLTEQQLRLCVSLMINLHQKAGSGSLTAVHKKYSGAKFHAVATLAPAVLPADDGSSQC